MERADLYMLSERLNIDIADGSKRHSTAGLKTMNQSFAFNVRKLLLDSQNSFGCNFFSLEFALIFDSITKPQLIRLNAFHRVVHQHSLFRQRVQVAGADFSQRQTIVLEND